MTKEQEKLFNRWYQELWYLAQELELYYDIDKVKSWSVFVWTKDTETEEGENVFDINDDGIVMYVKDHKIIEEAKPIIEKIQKHFKNKYYK